jgi:hypothetical protein
MLRPGVIAKHQCAGGGGVVIKVSDQSSVAERVVDLAIGDAVLAGRSMDLHMTPQS